MLTMGTPRRDQGVGHAVALSVRGDVVAVGAPGSRSSGGDDGEEAVSGNTPYRYWGMSNAEGGTWFNTYHRFRWATFADADGNVLNDATYYCCSSTKSRPVGVRSAHGTVFRGHAEQRFSR